jgi:glycine hydroxymethyltransferase
LMHIIAAKAVAFGEALTDEFKTYQKNIIENAKELSTCLLAEGFNLVSGGTDNHLMLLDLRPFGVTGKDYEIRLDEVHITANKNAIPFDPQPPMVTSGLRVGTPAVTSRGFGKAEMKLIANWMKLIAVDFEKYKDEVNAGVKALCEKFPIYR